MNLDFSYKGNLCPMVSKRFESISYNLRGPFTNMVSQVSKKMSGNLDWWVGGPSSRNTLASPFFHYYCILHLINEIKNNKMHVSTITVDSIALNKIIKEFMYKNNFKIKVKLKKQTLFIYLFIPVIIIYKLFKEIIKITFKYFFSFCTKFIRKPIPKKKIKSY